MDLKYYTNTEGKIVTIIAEYEFKKSVYPNNEYLLLKYNFCQLIKKLNEKVVLSKD